MKSIYVTMCGDILHSGHINMIERAAELGEVTVGLLSDEAVAAYKRVTFMPFSERERVVSALAVVKRVVAQVENTPKENLLRLKPDVFVHGDDWKYGKETWVRDLVIETLSSYGGMLVEFPYSEKVSSTDIQARAKNHRVHFGNGTALFIRSLKEKSTTRGISAGNFPVLTAAASLADQRKRYDVNWLFIQDRDTADSLISSDLLNLVLTGTPVGVEFSGSLSLEDMRNSLPLMARIGVSVVALPGKHLANAMKQPDWLNFAVILQDMAVCITEVASPEDLPTSDTGLVPAVAVLLQTSDQARASWPEDLTLGLRIRLDKPEEEDSYNQAGIRLLVYDGRRMADADLLRGARGILESIEHSKT